MKVEVFRDGKAWGIEFARGNTTKPLYSLGDTDKRGTKVTFKPDATIFTETVYSRDTLANRLRDAGITTTVYLGTKKFGKQLDYAIKDGFTHIVTVGGDELSRGVAKIKNLATREETEASLDALAAQLTL
jgi:DNA gyrase subunit B